MILSFADNFVANLKGADFQEFSYELIRQVAIQPSYDEAAYTKATEGQLADMVANDIRAAYARRAQMVAQTAMPVIKNLVESNPQAENMYIPITNGTLVYNVLVNLKKCVENDGAEIYKMFTKIAMLTTIDDNWREHLREMDDLKQSVQNATYEQKDPLLIYKGESYGLFENMINKVNQEVISILMKGFIPTKEQAESRSARRQQAQQKVDVNKLQESRMAAAAQAGQGEKSRPMPVHVEKKVRPNDPCPCGSGKKYKHCHGA
jgi:preprotein translocase subunit SecA